MFDNYNPSIRNSVSPCWPKRDLVASLTFFLFSNTGTSFYQLNNIGTELIIDYNIDFTTHEIFQTREALINWSREVGKSRGFIIVIKKTDIPKPEKRKEGFFLVVSTVEHTKFTPQ